MAWAGGGLAHPKMSLCQNILAKNQLEVKCAKFSNFDRFCSQNLCKLRQALGDFRLQTSSGLAVPSHRPPGLYSPKWKFLSSPLTASDSQPINDSVVLWLQQRRRSGGVSQRPATGVCQQPGVQARYGAGYSSVVRRARHCLRLRQVQVSRSNVPHRRQSPHWLRIPGARGTVSQSAGVRTLRRRPWRWWWL